MKLHPIFMTGLLWLYLLFVCHLIGNIHRVEGNLEPGYLDFDNLPDTNFSCIGKVIGGYYADLEANCQMFHVCTIGQMEEPMDIRFLCLNGTVFDQETRVCERVDEVDCVNSEKFYSLNLELYGNTAPALVEAPETKESHQTTTVTPTTTPYPSTVSSQTETTTIEQPIYHQPSTTLKTISPTEYIIHHPSAKPSTQHPPEQQSPKFRPQPTTNPILFNHRYPLLGETDEDTDINLNPETPPKISDHVSFSYSKTHTTTQKPLRSSQNVPHDLLLHQTRSTHPFGRRRNQTRVASSTTSNIYNYRPEEDPSDLRYHYFSTTPTVYLPQRNGGYDNEFRVQHNSHAHSVQEFAANKRIDFVESTKKPDLQLPLPFNQPEPFKLRDHVDIKRDQTHALPRVIVSASATISDANGRKLNITLGEIDPELLMLHDGKPPSTYDEYKDADVGLDPFYHDVPKLHKKRHIDYDEYVNDNYEPDTYKNVLLLEPADKAIEQIENLTKSKYVDNRVIDEVSTMAADATKRNETNFKLKSIEIVEKKEDQLGCGDNRFRVDTKNCRVFHYCVPGFLESQVLHLQFVCHVGMYFNDNVGECELRRKGERTGNTDNDDDFCKLDKLL